MKSKIKKNIKYNFINSQNYILGKSEKRKLLSKFFTEKFIFYYNKILELINKKLPNGLLIYLIIYSIIFIFIPLLNGFIKHQIAFTIYSLVILGCTFLFFKDYKIFKWFNFKYSNKNYFLISKYSYIHLFFKYFILFFLFIIFSTFNFSFLYIFYLIISFLIIFLDFFKILLIPIIILLSFIIYIYQYIYMIFFRGENGYFFIKYTPISKYLKKFKVINKKSAENKYYKIIEKL